MAIDKAIAAFAAAHSIGLVRAFRPRPAGLHGKQKRALATLTLTAALWGLFRLADASATVFGWGAAFSQRQLMTAEPILASVWSGRRAISLAGSPGVDALWLGPYGCRRSRWP